MRMTQSPSPPPIGLSPGYAEPWQSTCTPSDLLAPSFVAGRFRFILGLGLVTIGAGAFAVAFRASLTAVYQTFYGADNIVDAIAKLPRWLRLWLRLLSRGASRVSELRARKASAT